VPDGFSEVPVFMYESNDNKTNHTLVQSRQLGQSGNAKNDSIKKQDSTFKDHLDLLYALKKHIQKEFHLTAQQSMGLNFYNLSYYCDSIVSKLFEGVLPYNALTKEVIHQVLEVTKWFMVKPV